MKYKCMCKATNKEDKELRYSQNWAFAKRAMFKIYEDRIECGSWIIKNADIEKAHVYKTSQWFIRVNVLQLITNTGTYQFGFNPWANPIKHLKINFSKNKVKLSYSFFSTVIRLVMLAIICYEIWTYF